MLIVPAEYRFDLRTLPFGTLIVFLLCIAVYVFYQGNDSQRIDDAMSVYVDSGLVEYEQGLRDDYAAMVRTISDPAIAINPGFDEFVREDWRDAEPSTQWIEARDAFETARGRISTFRFGLVPADVRPAALLGHMFLHGGWLHLAGNLLFLVLFGLLLERVIGTALFLAAYVLTGVLAAEMFVALHAESTTPLVGASGAISGLMGAYLGVYGLRKIRFFYTAGFWFGQFKAPALLIFPLWLAKEIHGHFVLEGSVAYMAHAGGLLAGLALSLLLKSPARRVLDADERSAQTQGDRERRLVRIRNLMTDMRLSDAVRLLEESIRLNASEPAYWQAYAEAAARHPVNGEYDRMMSKIFESARHREIDAMFLRGQLGAYQERCGKRIDVLAGAPGAALARRFYREGLSRDLDLLLDTLFRSTGFKQEFRELLNTLLEFAERNNDRRRAERYRRYFARIQVAEPS